ncbi:histone-lysine N-methyltransferase SETDB2 isoform X2 [Hippoglossus stenolepis]|uniref:histone-lysine N-methyltransferase SETDB2 isoform X2 n=1 Tax=Hippoglossus stenolepis TaxID=195615 RepID=UPI00159CA8C8|nr:histone-lysine N-methyltransferase SETDB2 isoform X2 [Hippoglossus stenolepis]
MREAAAALDPRDVERAQAFWAEEDVDQLFNGVLSYLDHLKRVLKKNTATDKELVQALKLLESLDLCPSVSVQDSSVVQVVIGAGEVLPADFPRHSPSPSTSPVPPTNGLSSPAAPPAVREELLPLLAPVQLQYHPHTCCKTCMPSLPSMPQSMPLFWAQNPLKVPLLCGFKRLSAVQLMSPGGGAEPVESQQAEQLDADDWDVVYRAPCGQILRNHDDVMDFLLATEIDDVLQVDFFTFNRSVHLDPPVAPRSQRPELDLSRGVEPTPVELCPSDGGARPAEFRYRRDRWPHGCFLSRGATLFNACCDCVDGCTDAQSCACIAMNRGGRCYSHHRLSEPESSGLYECGPWCGCDRARCQNRLVQRGIRVRLQVFQTEDRGWGVRCRDDVDRGTFVCIYAGVILQRVQTPLEPLPPKLARFDLPSDDEVEVVTEWLAPPVLEGRSNLLETSPPPKSPPTSPPLHVPVIQRPPDAAALQVQTVVLGGPEPPPPSGPITLQSKVKGHRPSGDQKLGVTVETAKKVSMKSGSETSEQKSLKRAAKVEDVHVLDASREGNVSRFINLPAEPLRPERLHRLPRPRLPRHRLLHQQEGEGRHGAHLELLRCRTHGRAAETGSDVSLRERWLSGSVRRRGKPV